MEKLPQEIQELVIKRKKLRKEEKFQEADVLRGQIGDKGYEITDTEKGIQIFKKDADVAQKNHF